MGKSNGRGGQFGRAQSQRTQSAPRVETPALAPPRDRIFEVTVARADGEAKLTVAATDFNIDDHGGLGFVDRKISPDMNPNSEPGSMIQRVTIVSIFAPGYWRQIEEITAAKAEA